jgi:hypothetical protein
MAMADIVISVRILVVGSQTHRFVAGIASDTGYTVDHVFFDDTKTPLCIGPKSGKTATFSKYPFSLWDIMYNLGTFRGYDAPSGCALRKTLSLSIQMVFIGSILTSADAQEHSLIIFKFLKLAGGHRLRSILNQRQQWQCCGRFMFSTYKVKLLQQISIMDWNRCLVGMD